MGATVSNPCTWLGPSTQPKPGIRTCQRTDRYGHCTPFLGKTVGSIPCRRHLEEYLWASGVVDRWSHPCPTPRNNYRKDYGFAKTHGNLSLLLERIYP